MPEQVPAPAERAGANSTDSTAQPSLKPPLVSWQERQVANIDELQKALLELQNKAYYVPSEQRYRARATLESLRCQLCGTVVVPFFACPGPYVCAACVNEFRTHVAGGNALFCDLPKQIITEDDIKRLHAEAIKQPKGSKS